MTSDSFGKTFAEFWATQGQALLAMQEQAAKAMTDGLQAMAAMPSMVGLPGASALAPDIALAGKSVVDLWAAATTMSRDLATQLAGPGAPSNPETKAFAHLTDPRHWLAGTAGIDDVLAQMTDGPRLADLWEVERLYARVMQAWMTLRRTGLDHSAIVLQAWLDAGRRFTRESGNTAHPAGSDAPDPTAALKRWTEIANAQLLETQCSEQYLRTQRDMIRASTELRIAQQALVEHFGKQYGFPTRTELDDVHRTVTELRREMRAMRRAMQDAARPQAAPQQAAHPVAPSQIPRKTIRATGTARQKRDSR
jgi:hypothetical protein